MSQQAEELLLKYKNGTCTPEEQELVERFFEQYLHQHPLDLSPEELSLLDLNIWHQLEADTTTPIRLKPNRTPYFIAAAASVLLLCALGLFWYPKRKQAAEAMADIPAGGNKATITLSNGKRIDLKEQEEAILIQDDQLVYPDGTSVLEVENTQDTLTIATPAGGQYHIILPDQSHVWLNAASQLRYPVQFGNDNRTVSLEGEAYFEVAKQSAPFAVRTHQQEVEVLGTNFNIMAYREASYTKTTLLQGAVKVSPLQDGSKTTSVVLKPGQQTWVTQGHYQFKQVSPEDEIGWKAGDFIFNEEPLPAVMQQLARWYDVSIAYEGVQPAIRLTSTISRSKSLRQVMEVLELNTGIHLSLNSKERSIIVKP